MTNFVITATAASLTWAWALFLAFDGDVLAAMVACVAWSLTVGAGLIAEGERVFS